MDFPDRKYLLTLKQTALLHKVMFVAFALCVCVDCVSDCAQFVNIILFPMGLCVCVGTLVSAPVICCTWQCFGLPLICQGIVGIGKGERFTCRTECLVENVCVA